MTKPDKNANSCTKKQYALFMKRTLSIYGGMRARRRKLEGQADKQLPFSLAHLRLRIENALQGAYPCRFCKVPLTIKNISPDHKIPVERGGKWSMQNIELICLSCNHCKGRLTAVEFRRLYNTLLEFDPPQRNEVVGRLKAGASVVRLRFLKH